MYISFFFFFNDTATTEIYTLSLHDALPIFQASLLDGRKLVSALEDVELVFHEAAIPSVPRSVEKPKHTKPASMLLSDRKSTRLNSSHGYISYAVFCLKKKNNEYTNLI